MTIDFKTVLLTVAALIAFASNSLLTRLALGSREIGAAAFTSIRLVTGAVVLGILIRAKTGSFKSLRFESAIGPIALFAYAAPFSFAYLRVGAAVGALVLFGVVQLTMIGSGILSGERPTALTSLGLVVALAGLAMLTVPSISRPDPLGVALMTIAGIAWAVYSLSGRKTSDPLATNARNFLWSALLALPIGWMWPAGDTATLRGVTLAVISGGIASGLGYAVWYRVLPRLTVIRAAVAQLTVPVIAAIGAALFLDEKLSSRFIVASLAILGGVGLVVAARSQARR